MNNELDLEYNLLVDNGVATEEEIQLVFNINGTKLETLEEILYARTALRSFDQLQYELTGSL